ncbi:hypothetical protein SUGI_0933360 [Cryptomeria japonica]|nr:hypothetical protein SUGI_0933360 [Cryptomeria japonica]
MDKGKKMERCIRVLGVGIVMVVAIIMGIQHASKLEFKKGAEAEKENGLFDERLEATVRLYQSSFNLEVTGFLDAPTIQSLSLSRCGREDAHAPLNLLRLIKSKPWNLIAEQNKWSSSRSNLTYSISSIIFSPVLSNHDICLEETMIKIQFDGDGDGDEWVFEFVKGEHRDEDGKMKIDFLRRFLVEDDDVAASTWPPRLPSPPLPSPPLLPKSCSHSA